MSAAAAAAAGDHAKGISLPVALTVDHSAAPAWQFGAFHGPIEENARRQQLARPREVPPPRARQTVHTVAAAAMKIKHRPDQSIVEIYANNNAWYSDRPEEAVRALAAPELLADLYRTTHGSPDAIANRKPEENPADEHNGHSNTNSNRRSVKVYSPMAGMLNTNPSAAAATLYGQGWIDDATRSEVPRLKAAERALRLYESDQARRRIHFFLDDPLEPDDGQACPTDYAMLRELRQQYGAAFERRFEREATAGGMMPRVNCEVVPRAYFTPFFFPPTGDQRACALGANCICSVLARQKGRPQQAYVAREFLLPSEQRLPQPLPGPPRLCIHDLKKQWTSQVYSNIELKHSELEPINTFVVRCVEDEVDANQEGEYSIEYCLPNELGGLRTGIEGRVPAFSTHSVQYEQTTWNNRTFFYLAEVGLNFPISLSQANACLGAPKSRPLCGRSARRYVKTPRTSFFPRYELEREFVGFDAWRRFVRDAHTGVLLDRHFLGALEATDMVAVDAARRSDLERLPAAWLRLTVLPALLKQQPDLAAHPLVDAFTRDTSDAATGAVTLNLIGYELADAAFGSFERSLARWLGWLQRARADQRHLRYALVPLEILLQRHGPYAGLGLHTEAAGLPIPVQLAAALERRSLAEMAQCILQTGFVIWSCAVWRCAVSLIIERLVLKHPLFEQPDTRHRYFRDTHLDLLSYSAMHHAYTDDGAWFRMPAAEQGTTSLRAPLPVLAHVYPQCNRVCCVEELPDMTPVLPLANPWYDTGNKKAQRSVQQGTIHPLLCKVMPHSCQRRQYIDILERNAERFPVVHKLLRLISHVVMLGNVPHAVDALPLVARVRVNAALGILAPPAEIARFHEWLRTHQQLPIFILREFYFYTAEANGLIEEHLARSIKWTRFKELVRLANADWRREITAQTVRDFYARLDWSMIEQQPNNTGRLAAFHDRSLALFLKLKKGRFEDVLMKKMTAVEGDVPIVEAEMAAWMQQQDRLQHCHFVTWAMAQRSLVPLASHRDILVMPTRFLQALGMTRAGLEDVRQWIFEYYEYDMHDDGLKKKVRQMGRRSVTDYVLLKIYLRLFNFYRNNQIYFLSIQQTMAHVSALRASLELEPWTATTPLLGMGYFCTGCLAWANDIVRPTTSLLAEHGCSHVPAVDLARASFTMAKLEDLAFEKNANDGQVASLAAAYYHPLDGQLYCRRSRLTPAETTTTAAAAAAAATAAAAAAATPVLAIQAAQQEDAVPLDDDQEPQDHVADDDQLAAEVHLVDDLTPTSNPLKWARRHAAQLLPAEDRDGENDARMCKTTRNRNAKKKKNKKSSSSKPDISRLLLDEFRCGKLVKVDMVGVLKKVHQRLYGLCVYCGRLAEFLNCNVTTRGLSCGQHGLASEYPAYHRIWASLQLTRDVMRYRPREALSAAAQHAIRPPCIVPECAQRADHMIDTYDFRHRRFQVGVCEPHRLSCRGLLPGVLTKNMQAQYEEYRRHITREYGAVPVSPPPIRIDILLYELLEAPPPARR